MDSESHQQLGYGLLRFRSAPSSFLGGFGESGAGKASPVSEGFEADKFTSRFTGFGSGNVYDERPKESSPAASPRGHTGLPPQYPRPGLSSSAMDGSYGAATTMGMDQQSQPKGNNSPSIARQSISPTLPNGLFSQFSSQNGYAAAIKGAPNFRAGNGFNGEVSLTNRLKAQLSFQSSLGMLSQISEIGNESLADGGGPDNSSSRLGIGIGESRFGGPGGFQFNSWNNSSSHFSDNLASLKRERESEFELFPGNQNGGFGNRGSLLSHHLSLPRSSSDMSAMEKLLHFPESAPCKVRAKRGCATHPRSIAERVRRTRISERMRKLQDLVPNMDKQTNTADMLDLAVDYIKDLQKQFKALNDSRANCKCSNTQKSIMNQMI